MIWNGPLDHALWNESRRTDRTPPMRPRDCYRPHAIHICQMSQENEMASTDEKLEGIQMSIVRTYNNWRPVRETRNGLDRFPSRWLDDLGIRRSGTPAAARQLVR